MSASGATAPRAVAQRSAPSRADLIIAPRRAYVILAPRSTCSSPMPITAKLSRMFYEKFGDELTNELVDWFNQVDATYRSELRELNELNFARFDAKLEQRVAELRAELASLEGRLLARLGGVEGRFGTLEGRLVRWMFLFWVASLGTSIALIELTR